MAPITDGLPRVTRILQAAGLVDDRFFTDYAAMRGTALHLACQFLDEGTLDWETVDPLIVGRLRQYQRFKEEAHPYYSLIEAEVRNDTLRYAGRLDRVAEINGRKGILDIKSGATQSWHQVQNAGYGGCFREPLARWSLYLTDDGYKLVEHKSSRDWTVFKAALTLVAWREEHEGR